jgi:2-oxoglutarate ferredoxin oxidoreductase subunit alpha
MTELRAAKVAKVADDIPPLQVDTDGDKADLLVLGWGSTFGTIRAAVRRSRADGKRVDAAHLRHLNPFPRNLGEALGGYRKVLIPELNTGQLSLLVRGRFLVDAASFTKVQGQPIFADELEEAIADQLRELE